MKIKSLLVAALALVTMASCSKDDGGNNGEFVEGKPTVAQLKLVTSNNTTRTHYGDLTPNTAEETIQTAIVYIFNSSSILEKVVSFPSGSNTETFETTTGTKYFYAVANVPAGGLPTFSVNSTHMNSVIQHVVNVTKMDDVASTTTGYFMTSEKATAVLGEYDENDVENNGRNNVTISVGRGFAKVGVLLEPVEEIDGTLKDLEYKVMANPNKMYYLAYWNSNLDLLTPNYQLEGGPAPKVDYTNYNTYYFDNTTYLASGTSGTPAYYTNPSYMMENSNSTPYKIVHTYLMMKGVFLPEEAFDKDGENPDNTTLQRGDTFWRIKDDNGQFTDKYYYARPTVSEVEKYGDPSTVNDRLCEYKNGVGYYTLWLADANQSEFHKRYTIKRNTYWGVTITSVNGAGEPSEDKAKPDPDDKLEVDTYMKATIEILDWEPREQLGGI